MLTVYDNDGNDGNDNNGMNDDSKMMAKENGDKTAVTG